MKLYLASESAGDEVRQALGMADSAATSSVAYVEALSAFSRQRRERKLSAAMFEIVRTDFIADWPNDQIVQTTAPLLTEAGRLAERHGLKALDAIHLASYLDVVRSSDEGVELSSYDKPLSLAARSALRALRR